MTKADIVDQIAERTGLTKKDVAETVDSFLSAVAKALANGHHIEIRGFGTFRVKDRKSRIARNPRTGEAVPVPPRKVPVFKVSKVGNIAGCRVTDGTVERGANVRLIRDNVVIHEGKLSQLKRFKDDVKEVGAGQECGMAFENYQDMRQGDVIECYRVETIQRSL